MKKNLNNVLLISILISFASCGTKEAQTSAAGTDSTDEVAQSNSMTAKPAVCIWKEVGVRETPEEKGKYKTTIYLGEKITALGDTASELTANKKNKYLKIKLIDDTEGWVREDFIVVEGVPAAFIKEAIIYKRPDMMTSSDKKFNQLDFVAIKKAGQDGWAEVIGKRMGDTWFSSGWVKAENLTTENTDVAFSVFYTKAMEIQDEQKRNEELKKILENTDLTNSVFYSVVATEESEEQIDMPVEETSVEAENE